MMNLLIMMKTVREKLLKVLAEEVRASGPLSQT